MLRNQVHLHRNTHSNKHNCYIWSTETKKWFENNRKGYYLVWTIGWWSCWISFLFENGKTAMVNSRACQRTIFDQNWIGSLRIKFDDRVIPIELAEWDYQTPSFYFLLSYVQDKVYSSALHHLPHSFLIIRRAINVILMSFFTT